jgi:hypothetical protein
MDWVDEFSINGKISCPTGTDIGSIRSGRGFNKACGSVGG